MSAPVVLQIVKPPPKVALNVISPPQKKTGLHRTDDTDCFYTRPEIAQSCIDHLLRRVDISAYDVIIEPSAGEGAFVEYFRQHQMNIHSYDIEPGQPYITKTDFFTVDLKPFGSKRVLFIGNPPFKRQASGAKRFITRCSVIAQTIAFILPKSFKKSSRQKIFPLQFHLIAEMDLPVNSFTIDNDLHDVPCVFQVWDRRLIPRSVAPKLDPIGFVYVTQQEHPDFSLRRVGANAGVISEDSNKSVQSHYFIRLDPDQKTSPNWKETFMTKFREYHFADGNTVGPKSISKQEFTQAINVILAPP